jgi:hypothetical protein
MALSSQDDATELSQVERSLACIRADPGGATKSNINFKCNSEAQHHFEFHIETMLRLSDSVLKHARIMLYTVEHAPRMGLACAEPIKSVERS